MNNRAVKTEEKIENAFLELCLESGSFDISVSGIVARSHIGRSTFYTYYEDIYALMETIQTRLLEAFQKNMANAVSVIARRDMENMAPLFSIPMATFLQENKKAILVFMGQNGSMQFIYKMKQQAKKYLRRIFPPRDNKYGDYLLEFLISASFGLIVYWLENDCALSPEDLAEMLITIFRQGPLAVINRQI